MNNKIVVVHQHDIKDCGPCCLQSIIRYYDGYVGIEKLREDLYTTSDGTTVYHLVKESKKYGFDSFAKRVNKEDLFNIKLPAIVHIKYKNGLLHYMCLYQIIGDKYILMDPAKGKVKLSQDEFFEIFTGIVIEYYPNNKIVLLEKGTSIYKFFFKLFKDNKKLCIDVFICSIGLSIFTIIFGLFFKIVYESILVNKSLYQIKYIIYLFLLILLFKLLFDFWKNYYENHLSKNIDVGIYDSFISHIFHLPLKVITTRTTGEIMTRISEIGNIKELFTELFVNGILNVLLVIISFIVLININFKMAFILFAVMIIYIIISLLLNPYFYSRIKNNIDLQTEVNSYLVENIDMINSIKNLNCTKDSLYLIESKISKLLYDNYDLNFNTNVFISFKNCIYEMGIFIINIYGFYLVHLGIFSIADLVIFNNIMLFFADPIKEAVSLLPKYNYLRASFNKICDFINIAEEKMGDKEVFINGNIIFNNVSYSYNNYSNVIKNLNMIIMRGEKIMLKGKSGSGKSTICNLLEKNIIPTDGKIYIGDKNILDYSNTTIRDNLLYVSQKECILTDTIKNNINYLKKNNDIFDSICKICLIDEIVDKKAFRYDFGIDSNLTNISGGEKQRIVLARALCRNFEILILDEALSEVDYELEGKIINNIINFFPNKTIIYVSHKNQDKYFDRVVNLGNI